MIIELGHFALSLALTVSLFQIIFGFYSSYSSNIKVFNLTKNAVIIQTLLSIFSFSTLIFSYIISDFSIENVVLNSHTSKPLMYRISGTWGNHEGSLLMWVTILSIYGSLVSLYTSNLPYKIVAKILGTHGIINSGFLGFIILTSNPFTRIFPPPSNGNGLNPVLQDPGLAFHPPLLYIGYVGLTIPFCFAVAALLEGKVDAIWARWVRPWILLSWIFLTLGITLGSFWAYYELGWGGWWFWDPVENVSFLPWILTTALLHSARVTEKRQAMKSWTILLAIIAFSLSLLGTFIVRSGLLTSVHAFASDPSRGIYILSFLFLVTAGAFILFAYRFDTFDKNTTGSFLPISREGALLLNNVFFCSAAATVLLGTLWPILIEVVYKKSISVGPPYFEIVFLPLMLPAAFLSGISPMLTWKKADLSIILHRIITLILISIIITLIIFWIYGGSLLTFISLAISFWIIVSIFNDLFYRLKIEDKSINRIFKRARFLPKSIYGMFLAHIGVAIFILGVTVSGSWKESFEGILKLKETIVISKYKVTLDEILYEDEKNWSAQKGYFKVESIKKNFSMVAERRLYNDTGMPTTEAAIYSNFFNHLYIVIGDEQPANSGLRIVRIYYNPMVSFIWIGAIIMAIGGLVALCDNRLRQKKIKTYKSVLP